MSGPFKPRSTARLRGVFSVLGDVLGVVALLVLLFGVASLGG